MAEEEGDVFLGLLVQMHLQRKNDLFKKLGCGLIEIYVEEEREDERLV